MIAIGGVRVAGRDRDWARCGGGIVFTLFTATDLLSADEPVNAATSDKESKPGGHPNFIFKKAEEIDALVPMIAIGGVRVAAGTEIGRR